ncbi:hypothetical protein QT974_25845 [Microcoleus sp. herbarium12]
MLDRQSEKFGWQVRSLFKVLANSGTAISDRTKCLKVRPNLISCSIESEGKKRDCTIYFQHDSGYRLPFHVVQPVVLLPVGLGKYH